MFQNPLGLLALLAVPVIVGLHLFRRRFRPRVVSALFLWADEDRTPMSGRKRDKLRSSISLACEVLAAILLALVLAGPRGCDGSRGVHLVVCLDGSASMDARGADGRSAQEEGADLVRERVAELPRGSRVSLVASGPRPRVLAGPAAYPEEALAALERWRPTTARHDLAPAVALSLQLAGGGSVLLVTDRYAPDEVPPEVEVAAVGEPLDNVSIASATRAATRVEGTRRERVFVTLASHAASSKTVHATLVDASGAELAAPCDVPLEPGARASLAFDLPDGAPNVEVRVEVLPGGDALAIDDRAFLAPRPPRVVGIACELDEETRAVLGVDGPGEAPLARWLALCDEVVAVPDAAVAHVLLARVRGGGPATWNLVLQPARDAGERKALVGPFLAERRHPLLEGTTFEGIVWSADPALRLAGTPLVAAGNLPLLTEERDGPRRIYALDLDPFQSSLTRSPDWPILLANLVEERRAELPGASATNLVVGASFMWRATLPADDDGAAFVLRGLTQTSGVEARREHPARDVVVFDELDRPGFHRLERRGNLLTNVGVSFQDAAESDLRARSSGRRPAQKNDAVLLAVGSSVLLIVLLGGILALALIDWKAVATASAKSTARPAMDEKREKR